MPIRLTGNVATTLSPIPFPGSGQYADLESCNQGNPLSIPNDIHALTTLIFPNPVNDLLDIVITVHKQSSLSYHIFDMTGKKLRTFSQNNFICELKQSENLESLASGIYFFQLTLDGESVVRKLVKQ